MHSIEAKLILENHSPSCDMVFKYVTRDQLSLFLNLSLNCLTLEEASIVIRFSASIESVSIKTSGTLLNTSDVRAVLTRLSSQAEHGDPEDQRRRLYLAYVELLCARREVESMLASTCVSVRAAISCDLGLELENLQIGSPELK
jgi:hypothetical protein